MVKLLGVLVVLWSMSGLVCWLAFYLGWYRGARHAYEEAARTAAKWLEDHEEAFHLLAELARTNGHMRAYRTIQRMLHELHRKGEKRDDDSNGSIH